MKPDWDIVVIGAGAAGLLATAHAAERGKRTLLLEKNRKPGAKILMSGGTRCNLTQATDVRGIVEAFGRQGRFLHSALSLLGPQDVVSLFEKEGVPTKREATGKIFPASDKALDVQRALLRRVERSGAVLRTGEPLLDVNRTESGFELATPDQRWQASQVLITTGGASYPGCGTTGDGYRWLQQSGHTIVAPRPSLVPITLACGWPAVLSGLTLPDVQLRILEAASAALTSRAKIRPLAERRGSFLFTHVGVSGPVVLDVSRAVSGHPQPSRLVLECDLLPDLDEETWQTNCSAAIHANGKQAVGTWFSELLPRRLSECLLSQIGVNGATRIAEVSKSDWSKLRDAVKRLQLPIRGTLGFEKAEVTAGGVSLADIDSRTMASKRVPGLFVAGEILDLDGPIGGYNFQAAFSTGWLAGASLE